MLISHSVKINVEVMRKSIKVTTQSTQLAGDSTTTNNIFIYKRNSTLGSCTRLVLTPQQKCKKPKKTSK